MTVRIIIGGLLALALSGISMTCCYVFGTHLAPGQEGQLYGVLGGVADALKAVLPIGITAAFASRQRLRAMTGILLFVTFSAYSFASELGLYALSRDAQSTEVTAGKESFELLKGERERLARRLQALGETRPSGTIKADIAAQHQNRLWSVTFECKDASTTTSRTFCAGVERLTGELASAEEAESLRREDSKLTAKLSGMDLASVLKSTDPQSEALARFTGLAPSTMRDSLAVLVALLIELGSGLGLWAVTALPKESEAPNERDRARPTCSEQMQIAQRSRRSASRPLKDANPVKSFLQSCVSRKPESEVTAAELHAVFRTWAMRKGHELLSPCIFGRRLSELGCQRVKRGGVVRYVDMAVACQRNRETPAERFAFLPQNLLKPV